MKSLSCLSLSKSQEAPSPTRRHQISIDPYQDDTKTAMLGHKGPKMNTLIEVLRCELARPGRPAPTLGGEELGPSKQWTPIYYAAYHNREAALLHFLRAGHSPNDVTGTGQPPPCVAVAAGHFEIVKILCEAGADIKATTKRRGETALHLAIKAGRTDMIDLFLSYGPDLEARTLDTCETPLHYAAAKSGCLATVVTLLKHGASYEALDSKGCSPAEVAFQALNIYGAVAIISAARGKRNKLAKEKEMLLKHVEKAQNRFSMNNELIADIFEAGCDPNSTVLVEAIKKDDVSLSEMFLQKGADPNRSTATGIYPLFAALTCSGAQMVHLLVKHEADVTVRDTEGLTVLQVALESHSAHDKEAISEIFETLLSRGADAKVTYPDGKTLLHQAVRPEISLARVAQRLLENGVKVNEQDSSGHTALHLSTQSRSCTEILLKYDADANLLDHNGLTPLLFAVTSANKETEPDLEPLIKVSKLRVTETSGNTALHIAAQKGLERTARSLLKHRAETTVLDSRNRTPLLLAVQHHQWSTIPLLATQPGINTWDLTGMTALHHVAMSIPQPPAAWKDIASAAAKFCERGVSRSMRDRSGATPLIQAVKTLSEDGLSVIEVLLAETGGAKSNCVEHEDHKQRSALHFAATLGKPVFVKALLKHGATFMWKEWTVTKGPLRPTTPVNKQTLKLLAEHEWLRRAVILQRQSGVASTETTVAVLPKVLPIRDLIELLSMGLDPNALPIPPKSKLANSLLWTILNQTMTQPPLPPKYLYGILKLIFSHHADPNTTTSKVSNTPRSSQVTDSQQPSTLQPISFLLEQYPTVDINLITLFLDSGANLLTASPFYEGRYPLHSAVQSKRLDLVDEFLTRGADANLVDAKQHTPLFIAAEKGAWEIADLLLRCGAKADAKDVDGNSPLHGAVAGGSARIVSCLLRAGAKAGVKNKQEMTPLLCISDKLAEKEKNKITAMLKNAEEQESREHDRNQKQLEQEAMLAGKERARKEREGMQRMSKQPATLSPSPENTSYTAPTTQLHASPDPVPKFATTVQFSKQRASVRHTSLSPKRELTNPTSKPSMNTEKALPQPRIDSGFGYANAATKPLPVSSKNKTTLSNTDEEDKVEPQEELAGWLTMSKMLDRL